MHARRRQRLLGKLGDGLLILQTAAHPLRNGDVHFEFRPGSDLYYLTGSDEPSTVLLAWRVGRDSHRSVLFVPPRNKDRETWDGPRAGVKGAVRKFGVDEAHPIESLWEKLQELLLEQSVESLPGRPRVFHTLMIDESFDRRLMSVFQKVAAKGRRRNAPAHPDIADPLPAIAALRQRKDQDEIELLEAAVRLSVAGHRRAMVVARRGMMEYEVQSVLESEFRRAGSRRNGYESIVASGPNACILHYVKNDRKLRKGDLLLIDAGAEVGHYTADITRTFPVDGRFTTPQKAIYRAVLAAQKAGIRAVKPGARWDAPHKACIRVLTRALHQLKLLRGRVPKLIKDGACRKWFMHGTSHWLGMDVHDAGSYEDADGNPTRFRAGMVLTVEPGLYFAKNDRTVPAEYRGIGVRIEDDVLVTRGGCRVLTAAMPKEVKDVEALCSEKPTRLNPD